jgi:hypothetical protein
LFSIRRVGAESLEIYCPSVLTLGDTGHTLSVTSGIILCPDALFISHQGNTLVNKQPWTLDNALPMIRTLATIAEKQKFSTALYGSVLVNGQGDDLDLYFMAQEVMTTESHVRACLAEVEKLPEVKSCPFRNGCTSTIWLKDGRRIDAHFLEYTPIHS